MTSKKQTSKNGPSKKDGKKGPADQLQQQKSTVKYVKNCKFKKTSKINGHIYCKKNNCASYCLQDPDSKHSAFVCPLIANQDKRSTVKYTFERSKEDIKKLEELRDYLQGEYWTKTWNTDSEIYRKLPDLYFDAVKKNGQLQGSIDELTAKLNDLEDLRTSICRILELCYPGRKK